MSYFHNALITNGLQPYDSQSVMNGVKLYVNPVGYLRENTKKINFEFIRLDIDIVNTIDIKTSNETNPDYQSI